MKHIHFIGICGVTMSALAILWKKKGWKVTGSDVGFYPPISTHLTDMKVEYYPGWHPEKMGKPDLVVVGNVAGSENPEWKYVQENKIPYVSYPELIANNLIKENSIICAGTYGKTSSAVLLSWILKEAGYNPAYMFGGLSANLPESSDDPTNSKWSVMEGDEYKTARWDNKAKFFSYKPTHLLLTSVKWDHADVYLTEQSYFGAFKKLVEMIPASGKIVASENAPVDIFNSRTVVTYGQDENAQYRYSGVTQAKDALSFAITYRGKEHPITVPIIGEYMAENICGAFAMACEIGIDPQKTITALNKFKGIKRRMEKRGQVNSADVFDDIAHSPTKAKSALETVRKIYTQKIYAIFEPNTGNRKIELAAQYDNAFSSADEVIIPRLTKVKAKPGDKNLEGDELAQIISKTQPNTKYFEDDSELIAYLKQKTRSGDAVVFLGSHGFRGMLDNLISA